MKKIHLILSLICFCLSTQAQYKVYDTNNEKQKFRTSEALLILTESDLKIVSKQSGKAFGKLTITPATIGTQLLGLGFKIGADFFEGRAKKFTAEYSAQSSYLQAGNKTFPDITFTRKVDNQNALTILFKAKPIDSLSAYCYCIESIDLGFSKAKTTNKSKRFDYVIELQPIFLVEGKKHTSELNPITINSVGFGETIYNDCKYRSGIIVFPQKGFFSEVAVKLTETNPVKANAEDVLAAYNKYKDDAKMIVNNFISND